MFSMGVILFAVVSSVLAITQASQAAKVVEFGPKLPEFIKQYPDKNWLIKFYDPRCYYCQQLEPTYINVAEKVSHKHDNLIVGKVDCTQNFPTCSQYKISSYPTILLIKRDNNVTYNGARSINAILSFTDRFLGPDVLEVRNCEQLQDVVKDKGVIVLSTFQLNNKDNIVAKAFKSMSKSHKTSWWFYHVRETCRNLISDDAIYILKHHLKRSIKFNPKERSPDYDDEDSVRDEMFEWLEKESFPVYTPISRRNYEAVLKSKKLIIMAVLDEYKPARKFSQPSSEFNDEFKKFAIKSSQHNNGDFIFGWSADLDLVQSITIGEVPVPNVMILREDLSYRLLIEDFDPNNNQSNLISQVNQSNVRKFIDAVKKNKLIFYGGNSYFYQLQRTIFEKYIRFKSMFKSDPLLAAVLIVSPLLIMVFVIWNTCFDSQPDGGGESEDVVSNDGSELYDEEIDSYREDEQNLLEQHHSLQERNHKKQD